jgi:hypothetical protein
VRTKIIAAIWAANDEISRPVLLVFLTSSILNITFPFSGLNLDMHEKIIMSVVGSFTVVLREIQPTVTWKVDAPR